MLGGSSGVMNLSHRQLLPGPVKLLKLRDGPSHGKWQK